MPKPQYGQAKFDRRQFPRLTFELPFTFQVANKKMPAGISSNLSVTGMMAFFPQAILLPFTEKKRVIKTRAEVVWTQTGRYTNEWSCNAGLRLFEMPPDSLQIWEAFLKEWGSQKKS